MLEEARRLLQWTAGYACPKTHSALMLDVLNRQEDQLVTLAQAVWTSIPPERLATMPAAIQDQIRTSLNFLDQCDLLNRSTQSKPLTNTLIARRRPVVVHDALVTLVAADREATNGYLTQSQLLDRRSDEVAAQTICYPSIAQVATEQTRNKHDRS